MHTFITFGSDHDFIHSAILGDVRASNGFVVIEAPTRQMGVAIAQAIFGIRYAFDYSADQWYDEKLEKRKQWYPLGAMLEIQWHLPLARLFDEGRVRL